MRSHWKKLIKRLFDADELQTNRENLIIQLTHADVEKSGQNKLKCLWPKNIDTNWRSIFLLWGSQSRQILTKHRLSDCRMLQQTEHKKILETKEKYGIYEQYLGSRQKCSSFKTNVTIWQHNVLVNLTFYKTVLKNTFWNINSIV